MSTAFAITLFLLALVLLVPKKQRKPNLTLLDGGRKISHSNSEGTQ